MPFVLQDYKATKGKKIQLFLIQELGFQTRYAQKIVSRARVFDKDKVAYKMSDEIKDEIIYIAEFQGESKGLKPMFISKDFAIFDKPTKVKVHPVGKHTDYCLLDEIKHYLGSGGNLVHRIDAETSGLVLVARDKKSEIELKSMFENKEYKKGYIAVVDGEIKEEMIIDTPLEKEGKLIGIRMMASNQGKESLTIVKPIKYSKNKDLTLVEVTPITGRQHQIRVHLYSVGHRILGDPIYGIDDDIAERYLTKDLGDEERFEVTGAERLWLQANYLEFEYKGIVYKFYSKQDEIKNILQN